MPSDREAHALDQPWRSKDLPVPERLQTLDGAMTGHRRLPCCLADYAAAAHLGVPALAYTGGGNGLCALASSSESSIAGFRLDVSDHQPADRVLTQRQHTRGRMTVCLFALSGMGRAQGTVCTGVSRASTSVSACPPSPVGTQLTGEIVRRIGKVKMAAISAAPRVIRGACIIGSRRWPTQFVPGRMSVDGHEPDRGPARPVLLDSSTLDQKIRWLDEISANNPTQTVFSIGAVKPDDASAGPVYPRDPVHATAPRTSPAPAPASQSSPPPSH